MNRRKITIITSLHNIDKYIDIFLLNVSNIIGYDKLCEHHMYNIVDSHSNNTKMMHILTNFSKKHQNVTIIDIENDPGLYTLWNTSIKASSTPYLMTLNVDDSCSPDYIIKGLHMLDIKDNTIDLICSPVNVVNKIIPYTTPNLTNKIWYKTKKIYYDTRYNKNEQLRIANIRILNTHPNKYIELKPNRKYKQNSYNIPTKYKASINAEYTEFTQEDMFVDWNNNNQYDSYNIPHCTPIWRKSLHTYGLFNEEKHKASADFKLWLQIYKLKPNAKYILLHKPYIQYYENPNSYGRKDTLTTKDTNNQRH